ncbi:MAG: ROK family protein [Acidobacteria bacterium]|nr:ROK family protein [Acidobacteriota bacterium]
MREAGGSGVAVALDLGGTKLASAIVDGMGQVLASRKVAVAGSSPADTIGQIVEVTGWCVEAAGLTWSGIDAAGVIVPGIYNPREGTAWTPNLWGDRDVPLAAELAVRLPVPVCIDSDRAGYVLGEQWLGVARGLKDVIFVAVGTGIGAGILSGGRLIRGAGDIAGAVGWMALNPGYQEIYQRVGCWEAEAAGPSLARRTGQASAESVVEAARRGEPTALAAIEHAAGYLAMGIANLISVLNPEMVVLGGGLMQAGDLFLDPVRRAVPRWAQPRSARQARIELSALEERAGLLGAARLALEGETAFH